MVEKQPPLPERAESPSEAKSRIGATYEKAVPSGTSSRPSSPLNNQVPSASTTRRLASPMKTQHHRSLSSDKASHSSKAISYQSIENVAATGATGYAPSSSPELAAATSSDESSHSIPRTPPRERILEKLSSIIGSKPQDLSQPSALDNPPRRLLLHAPFFQVVNANTVKDRYLFLFNDILIVTKPWFPDREGSGHGSAAATLDTEFMVKSIVELDKLQFSASRNDESPPDDGSRKKHPLFVSFLDRFANDPNKAIATLVNKSFLPGEPGAIANLIFRTPELNRSQIGTYLCDQANRAVLKAFVDRFYFNGIRLEDALRSFLSTLRIPNSYSAAEHLFDVFVARYLDANPEIGLDPPVASKLVISIMELSDALHSGLDDDQGASNLFSFPNQAISVDDFIGAFRIKDPHYSCPDEVLTRIYITVRRERLLQAADNGVGSMSPEIPVKLSPPKLPNRLTYRVSSDAFTISIPKPDPNFSIKLVGQDLKFEPSQLSFAQSSTATFRVTGSGVGPKTMFFLKLGSASPSYQGLPINKTFSVERSFMQHTFQLSFTNHVGMRRKYLMSTAGDPRLRSLWVQTINHRIEACSARPPLPLRAQRVAEAVALRVLRDALIAPEGVSPPSAAGRKAEVASSNANRPHGGGVLAVDRDGAMAAMKAGHEVVTIAQQNSLLPAVLALLNAGKLPPLSSSYSSSCLNHWLLGLDVAPNPLANPGGTAFHRVASPPARREEHVVEWV
jgi:hypothetical protein